MKKKTEDGPVDRVRLLPQDEIPPKEGHNKFDLTKTAREARERERERERESGWTAQSR
jgi:hypothetical protein